jgi:hypothetical protein
MLSVVMLSVMLSVVMLSVVMLNVVMLSVVMLGVVVPYVRLSFKSLNRGKLSGLYVWAKHSSLFVWRVCDDGKKFLKL